jgi:hypothetical protein
MPLVRVQVSFQGKSGLPRDQYVNTFFFQGSLAPAGGFLPLITGVIGLYTSTPAGGSQAVMARMSALTDDNNVVVKVYDQAAAPHSPPLQTESVGLPGFGGGSGSPLPTELAACLSYRAHFPTSVDPKRRRGRIYIGPLQQGSLQVSPTTEAILAPAFCDDLTRAAGDMAAVCNTAGYDWSVFSRANGVAYSIDEVWVDNAVDIQRRRGIKATARVTAAITP